jgi:hypothetical protein
MTYIADLIVSGFGIRADIQTVFSHLLKINHGLEFYP